MLCTGPFVITKYFSNGMANLQCGEIKIKHNIYRIHLYKSDTRVEAFNSINMDDAGKKKLPVLYFCFKLKLGKSI